MRDLLTLLAHLMATLARLLGPGGAKAVVANPGNRDHPDRASCAYLASVHRAAHRHPSSGAFPDLLRHAADSRRASGCSAATRRSTRAAPLGVRLPCSQ